MPKKQKGTEAEIHALTVKEAKMRLGCGDFAPDFTLRETHGSPNWDVAETRNEHDWPSDCAQAFSEAVARSRRKVNIAWP